MKRRNKKSLFFCIMIIFCLFFTSCDMVDNINTRFGLKNKDFDYIKQGNIQKIVIQNTRDRGFRFVVTDKNAISNLYSILSSAKEVQEKSTLKPDYVFEMYEDHDKIHKFNYIAGLDKKDGGNLYSNDKTYIVSSRLDNDIIKNFWNIRIPKDFKKIYYKSTIMNTIEEYNKYYTKTYGKNISSIGIDLNNDIDVQKFILSIDMDNFENELKDKMSYVSLMKKDNKYGVIMTIKTQGYKLTLYKAVINFYNTEDKSEKNYYILNEIDNGMWKTRIFDQSTKPDSF